MSGTQVVKTLVPWPEMSAAFDRAVTAVIELVRDLPPQAAGLPVPGLEWNVAETAGHLVAILGRGIGDTRRGETLQGMHDLNAQCLEELGTRDLKAIADRLEADQRRSQALRAHARGDEPFPLHAGVVAEVAAALSYGLWDFLVHGFDIARACGRDWPMPAEDAARVIRAGLPAVRPWVRPAVLEGPARRLAFRLFPGGDRIAMAVGQGDYAVSVTSEDVDAEVVDPAHLLLAISGRVPPVGEPAQRLASWYLPI